MLRTALLCIALLMGYAHAGSEEVGVAVIVTERSALKALSQADVAAAFLGMVAGRDRIQSIQPADSDDPVLREAFYQLLLGRSRNQMRAYWSRMVFTGQGKPPPMLSSEEVARDLMEQPNMIAYVRADQKIAGTRIVLRLP